MPNRTGWIALATAAMALIGTTTSANAREVVRYEDEAQPGTIVVKTAERRHVTCSRQADGLIRLSVRL